MIGQTISHYKIIEKIGEGGIAVVYKAEDTKLKRTVALKFLRSDAFTSDEQKECLIREARAAASLDHSNIRTVFGIEEERGQLFISMAYTRGITLKERLRMGQLDMGEAVDIAIEVAKGLRAAHKQGIIHRDIMSANIMVTDEGRVVILDFGMAELPDSAGGTGVMLDGGTTAYHSPEQCRGEPVDARTDIWSLGVCLYEMLAGALPFGGAYPEAVTYEILNDDPPPLTGKRPEISPELVDVVERTMAKNPQARFKDAGELLEALEAFKDSSLKEALEQYVPDRSQPSIAILPFADMSPERDQEYFCDGISEEIINTLNKVGGMRVVARTSSFAFKGKNVDIREIGRKLGVQTLLEGSVRKAGKQLRITAQLINAENGYHLFAEQYDREMADIFAIQDEITMAVVQKLRVSLLGEESEAIRKHPTANLNAYNLYLKGRFYWNKRTERGYRRALEFFEQAITEDPWYALAHVGVADCYNLLGWYGYLAPDQAFPESRTAAKKACEMDAALAEGRASLGWIAVNYDWDWPAAEREYRRALELKPSYASAHQWYAEYLSYMGRHDEAIREAVTARDLDPLSLIICSDLGQVLYYAREYGSAIDQLNKALEMDPRFAIAHLFIALAYAQKEMQTEALDAIETASTLAGESDTLILAQLGTLHAFIGDEARARAVLRELEGYSDRKYISPFWIALIHSGLDDFESAFAWFEKAYAERDHWMETLKVLPLIDPVRDDPRYKDFLKRMRFE